MHGFISHITVADMPISMLILEDSYPAAQAAMEVELLKLSVSQPNKLPL